jgi:protein involved in polysaccharide export with SLBB domain
MGPGGEEDMPSTRASTMLASATSNSRAMAVSRFVPCGLLVALVAVGCAAPVTERQFDSLQRLSLALAHARKDYRIEPGDTVRVGVYRGAQLPPEYQQQITVQPDGKIMLVNLPMPLMAAGLTTAELQSRIKEAYSPIFKTEPNDSGGRFEVFVQFLTSQRTAWLPDQIFVTGEVFKSATISYRRGITVMQAISQVGGWKTSANECRTVILRQAPEGVTTSTEVDLLAVVEHDANDIELFPGDVVFVPLSVIARINIWVDYYIRGLLPINPSAIWTTITLGGL